MEKKTFYCDYCGKQITTKNKPKNINTIWKFLVEMVYWDRSINIGGDGCNDCFKSFNKWKKSRRES